MNNLKHSLTRPLTKASSAWVGVFLVVALIGFADASYLTFEHYRGVIPPCTTDGCEVVLTSAYSKIAGIPVALLGALYYLAMAMAAFVYLESKHVSGDIRDYHRAILKWALLLSGLGMVCAAYFIYLQAFVIGAWCQYCLVSAATSVALFVIAVVMLTRSHENIPDPDNQL